MIRKLLASAVIALGLAGPSSAATVDLGFSLDSSFSVTSGNFDIVKEALAKALENTFDPNFGGNPNPGGDTYRIAVTNFSASVVVDVGVGDNWDEAH